MDRQLLRWVKGGLVSRLRRGLYILGGAQPDLFEVARRLVPDSYISLESALAHHGMLDQPPPVVLSVSLTRSLKLETSIGHFVFHRLSTNSPGTVGKDSVASPERALFDLFRLRPGSHEGGYLLRVLRLRHAERLDRALLKKQLTMFWHPPKFRRASGRALALSRAELWRRARRDGAQYHRETIPGGSRRD